MPVDVIDVYAAYEARIDAVRRRTIAQVLAVWAGLGSWFGPDIDRFVAVVVPFVEGAQRATAALTAAELTAIEATVMGTAEIAGAVGEELVTTAALRGVDAAEVWARPGREVWRRLAEGQPLDVAVDAGAARAEVTAATNLQLAKTHTARSVFDGETRIVGHRRVLKGRSCGLCTTAASQRYHKAKLLPIHGRCDCGVEPIWAGRDPGQVIDVKRVPVPGEEPEPATVHEHGELGPVLGAKGDEFKGPSDVP